MQRLPPLLHRQAEAGRHRRPRGALRAALRAARQEVADDRLDHLRAVKLGALVDDHWGKEGAERGQQFVFPGGSACVREAGDGARLRGWVLIDDGAARRFGGALTWAWGQGVSDLHVLIEGGPVRAAETRAGAGPAVAGAAVAGAAVAGAAGVVARRAAEMAAPPSVWAVSGRTLTPAVATAASLPAGIEAASLPYLELLRFHGAVPVFEHGVLRGEVLGLEVARVVDGRLEVGVGRHDRAARAELGGDADLGQALDQAVAAVAERRRAGAAPHPANTLARSRWLRAVVCACPSLVGAGDLDPVAPPLPAPDLTDNVAVPCIGVTAGGSPMVVVCSTGVDPDLIPTAADSRALYMPSADLVVVVPQGDDHPVTVALAAALARPASVRTVPRAWEGLGAVTPASGP